MTMLPSLSVLFVKLGIILMISRHLTYSLQDSPMLFTKRSTSSTTHRITCSGSIMPWDDNASGSMLRPALTSLNLPPLVLIGDHVPPLPHSASRAATPMPWTPPLDVFVLDLPPLMQITLYAACQHQEDKDKAMASTSGK